MFNIAAESVFRDFTTDGVPASGNWNPRKPEIRQMFAERDAFITAFVSNGGLIYATKALLDADLAHGANSSAWVIGDATVANNGIYRKSGASGAGSWTRVADLPYSFVRLNDVGAGTANAIQATSSLPLPASPSAALLVMNVYVANTGPVTINGKALVTNTGNALAAGYLQAGMFIAFLDTGPHFRLLTDVVSTSIVAAAEAAAAEAQTARDAALAAVPNVFPATRTALAALNTTTITSAYLKEAGREGQFVWIGTNQSANVTLDTRQGIYVPPASDVTGASGAWVRRLGGEILASWFGTVGDDAANDTAAWQGALKFAAGKTLCGEQGKTYNLTAELEIPDGCTLDLRKSRMNFRVTGSVRCVVPSNNCCVQNGTIKNFGTTAGIAGDYQCPISIGKFTANVSVANVRVLNMTIESDWNEGNGIIITAASNNILVENIKFPDSPMFCPVLAHWGGTAAGTGHPHDVIIRNITCGNINAAGYLISLAAAYNVLIENVKGGTCLYGFHNYAGDYTNMYASADVKPLVGKGVIARNIVAMDVREAGIWVDGQSFNPALTTPTATPVEMDGIIEKCRFYGAGAIAQTPEPVAQWGAKIANCRDLEMRNNHFEWFQYGVVPAGPTERVYVIGNVIRACSSNGIVVSFASSSPIDWVVERNAVQGVNRNGFTTDSGAAILVGNARNAKIIGNRVGFEASEFAFYGIRATTAAVYPVISDNWVQKLATGGAAYSVGSVTSYGINASGRNNRAAAGVTLWGGTTLLNDNGLGFREGVAVEGGAPSVGAWNVGDRLWVKVPTSTIVGHVCTTAGSPGTWRAFGT